GREVERRERPALERAEGYGAGDRQGDPNLFHSDPAGPAISRARAERKPLCPYRVRPSVRHLKGRLDGSRRERSFVPSTRAAEQRPSAGLGKGHTCLSHRSSTVSVMGMSCAAHPCKRRSSLRSSKVDSVGCSERFLRSRLPRRAWTASRITCSKAPEPTRIPGRAVGKIHATTPTSPPVTPTSASSSITTSRSI